MVCLSRPCFADPPAESPSTKNNSANGPVASQSLNFPGIVARPLPFLRSTILVNFVREIALLIACSAIKVATSTCSLSQRSNASLKQAPTNLTASRDESFSLVCPAKAGSSMRKAITYRNLAHTSSALILTLRCIKPCCSAKVLTLVNTASRNPASCVPPPNVGIKFT